MHVNQTTETISTLREKLLNVQYHPVTHKVLIGFDGYIDLIQKVVRSSEKESKQYYGLLNDLGECISAAAGKSAQLEVCTITTKLGGNAPIMANSLAHLGVQNHCIGTMGYPKVNEAFLQMHEKCNLVSIGEPGITNALEFDDGKLLLSELSSFETLDLPYILGLKEGFPLMSYLRESAIVAMVDWANLPLGTQLWKQMREYIQKEAIHDRIYFFDLCDPSKKTEAEIAEILEVISTYGKLGKVILGLNENEAVKVYNAIGSRRAERCAHTEDGDLEHVGKAVFDAMRIDILLVHPVDRCVIVNSGGVTTVKGHVVRNPKVLTGGGDNLNAGFCFGLLNSFSIEECAMLAMTTSGAYVQNGRSPSIADLVRYMDNF